MAEQTAISWCDHTFNLWIGCWKIDPECAHCYAEATDNQRWGGEHWGRTAPRKWTGDAYWKQLAKWNRKAREAGVRERVFVGSLMDWAERHPVPAIRAEMDARLKRYWALVAQCDSLDFLMLTKRPEDAAALLPWMRGCELDTDGDGNCPRHPHGCPKQPWPNVWIGVTAGTRETLARKAPLLRAIPAAVRFISCEPLLEEIDPWSWRNAFGTHASVVECPTCNAWVGWACEGAGFGYHAAGYHPAREQKAAELGRVDWLIVGNESGRKRRPAEQDWVRVARDAAESHCVSFHFKQWVESNGKKVHLPILDGVQHAAFPEVAR